MDKQRISCLFLDWNGTLVDDRRFCFDLLNKRLVAHGHPAISFERYLDVFTFPIIEYYKKAGFRFPPEGKDDFASLASDFRDDYDRGFAGLSLYPDVIPFLKEANRHLPVYLLSATPTALLLEETDEKGIGSFFRERIGIGDIYGTSKIDAGKAFIEREGIDPKSVLFIGDTLHDEEVAKALGAQAALISSGHQSEKVLKSGKKKETQIYPSLEALSKVLF